MCQDYWALLQRAREDKVAFVLPAFEQAMGSKAPLPTSFGALHRQYCKGEVTAFHVQHYAKGHAPTDYSRWFQVRCLPCCTAHTPPHSGPCSPVAAGAPGICPWGRGSRGCDRPGHGAGSQVLATPEAHDEPPCTTETRRPK